MEQIEQRQETEPQISSLLTRITNLFASPSELFEELSINKVQNSSWIVPLVILMLMALFAIIAIQFNESLKFQVQEIQYLKMQELVDQGKLTQEQADNSMRGMGSAQSFIIFGGISAMIMTALFFFLATLIFWLAAKYGLKFSHNFKKMLEIYSLTTLIGSMGTIVTVLLMYTLDSLRASPSLAIFIYDSFDFKNNIHVLLSQLNFFTIWQMGVLGYGIAKVSNKPVFAGSILTYSLWLIWVLTSTFLGFGIR